MSGMYKTERQSNWELMRIIAMLMIITGHFLGQSGFFNHVGSGEQWVGAYIGNFHRIAVNMFLFLGIWFMVDMPFKPRRIIKLYLNAWILTVPITIAVIVFGFSYDLKDVFRGLFPFIGKGVWFVSSYLALIMISPWLKKVFLLPQRNHRNLVIVLLVLISLWVTLYSFDRMEDQWLDCFVWFVYSYILIGYYKKYGWGITPNKWVLLFVGVFSYFVIVTVYNYCSFGSNSSAMMGLGVKITRTLLMDYKTLPNLLIAMCFFYFFQNLKIGVNKTINYIASGALTAYVFHQTPAFIPVLWHQIYQCDIAFMKWDPLLYAIFVIMSVYFCGLIIERVRRQIEPYILDSAPVRWVEARLGEFYDNR